MKYKPHNIFAVGYPFLHTCIGVVLMISGCATVGPSSVKLSADVGSRMSEMQELHQSALQSYFTNEKRRVEEFLDDTWEPLFLKNFLAETNVLNDLKNVSVVDDDRRLYIQKAIAASLTDSIEAEAATEALVNALSQSRSEEPTVVRTVLDTFVDDDKVEALTRNVITILGTEESAKIMLDFAAVAHEIMNETRAEMLEPLQQVEAATMVEVNGAYAQMASAQGLITGRLAAASKVAQKQDNLFDSLAGREDVLKNIRERLFGVSEVVGDALANANSILPNDGDADITEVESALEHLLVKLKTVASSADK